MKGVSLYIALQDIVNKFGVNTLNDVRLVNMCLDYQAFSQCDFAKEVLRKMLSNGDIDKIVELGRKKGLFSIFSRKRTIERPTDENWRSKVDSIVRDSSKSIGIDRSKVNYVSECILYSLGWIDYEPKYTKPLNSSLSNNIQLNNNAVNNSQSNTVSYKSISNSQFLVINVTPKDSVISVDGVAQNVFDGVMAVELSVGLHEYVVESSDYESVRSTVDICADDKTVIDVNLKPIISKIQFYVICDDKKTEIYLDGTFLGTGSWKGMLNPGTYCFEGKKHRFHTYKQSVDIFNFRDNLLKIPALLPITGSLKVNVLPFGSKVFVNGEEKGLSPLVINNLLIGERTLKVLTKEGTTYTSVVEVRENLVTEVNYQIPSLFLFDYSLVQLRDFFYEDGSFSHVLAKGKKVVGIVFSLETSDEEKKHGWTHGQIMSFEDCSVTQKIGDGSWGIANKELLKYSVALPYIWPYRDTGYLVSHLDCVLNNPEYAPFVIASRHKAPLPETITSGWYLPCIAQWRTFYENTHKYWDSLHKMMNITNPYDPFLYASSTLNNKNSAWKYKTGLAENYKNQAFVSSSIQEKWIKVRAVAAF